MEAEIWQWLPEDLLFMILARLPIRVLGKMRTVCKQWNSLLSSRDALQVSVPNWSLHSTPGFLLQIFWDHDDDLGGCWVIEERGLGIYKVPFQNRNRIVLNSCKSISCISRCNRHGEILALSIGIPGTMNWRELPRPRRYHTYFHFNGMSFDSSTRRCILLLGIVTGRGGIVMCIYDSESNGWTAFSTIVLHRLQPCGRAIYSEGMFYWAVSRADRIVAFNNANRVWRQISLPERCRNIGPENLTGYDGQVMVVEHKEVDCVRIWKLNKAKIRFEIWCELRSSVLTKGLSPLFPLVTVNAEAL